MPRAGRRLPSLCPPDRALWAMLGGWLGNLLASSGHFADTKGRAVAMGEIPSLDRLQIYPIGILGLLVWGMGAGKTETLSWGITS